MSSGPGRLGSHLCAASWPLALDAVAIFFSEMVTQGLADSRHSIQTDHGWTEASLVLSVPLTVLG